jgi:hypothetical protein
MYETKTAVNGVGSDADVWALPLRALNLDGTGGQFIKYVTSRGRWLLYSIRHRELKALSHALLPVNYANHTKYNLPFFNNGL